MATRDVILARKTGDGADLLLPRTSADLVGYENAEAAGVTDVAAALDNLFARSPGNISVLTGRVDALESGQVEQDADISAAGAAAADWTASKPGIVQRVEALEALSHPYQGVSQDAGNMATVGSDLGVMVPKGAPYTLTALPADANIDALDAGVYLLPASTTLQGHLPPEWAGSDDAVLIVFEDGNNPQVRRQRWLSSTNMFYREFYLSQVDLAIAGWNTISAPSPRPSGIGVGIGVVQTVAQAANVNAPYVVPAGGVWMVSVIFTDASGLVIDSMSYVVAGGTTVIPAATNYAVIRGFCWRII